MKRNSGFSLIETLFALMILGVGLVGLVEGITAALRCSKDSEYRSSAVFLASSRIELLRADGWLVSGDTQGDFGESFPLYSWTESVSETTTEGLYDVVVEVRLKESHELLFELRTRLFDMPLDTTLSNDDRVEDPEASRSGRRGGVGRRGPRS